MYSLYHEKHANATPQQLSTVRAFLHHAILNRNKATNATRVNIRKFLHLISPFAFFIQFLLALITPRLKIIFNIPGHIKTNKDIFSSRQMYTDKRCGFLFMQRTNCFVFSHRNFQRITKKILKQIIFGKYADCTAINFLESNYFKLSQTI